MMLLAKDWKCAMDELKHLLRLGTHAEKKYFKEFQGKYDAIVINANILAHTVSSMSSFLGCELSEKFLIDPQTYAFQSYSHLLQSTKGKPKGVEVTVKKSIQTLLDKYGTRLTNIIVTGKRSLKYSDFNDDEGALFLDELCQNVIDFQLNTVKNESTENSEYGEYIEYDIESNSSTLNLEPFALIAPYFYMTENTLEHWLPHNINSIRISKQKFTDKKIYAQIVIDKDILLEEEVLQKLIDAYSGCTADGFFIWIDNFDEKIISYKYLKNFIKLIKDLKAALNKPIYQIYGSYFSIMLTNVYLTGTCHGMEYGETRDVYPVGGGVPVSKFYLPSIHKRLLYREVLDVLLTKDLLTSKEIYFENVCSCKTCHEVIRIDPNIDFGAYGNVKSTTFKRKAGGKEYSVTMDYPTTDAKDLCLRHYLYNKEHEFQFVRGKNFEELKVQLEQAYNENSDILGDDLDYLLTWKRIIEECLMGNNEV